MRVRRPAIIGAIIAVFLAATTGAGAGAVPVGGEMRGIADRPGKGVLRRTRVREILSRRHGRAVRRRASAVLQSLCTLQQRHFIMIDKNQDALVGYGATAAGSMGLVAQWITEFGSALVIGINILLALGGLYLLYLRIVKARRDLRRGPAPPPASGPGKP